MTLTESLFALVEARLAGRGLAARGVEAGVEVVEVPTRSVVEVAQFLKTDADAAYELVDITVNEPVASAGCAVWILLVSRTHHSRARLEVPIDDDAATFPSLTSVWAAAGVLEREIIDLCGLLPEGHPHPHRLLLPDAAPAGVHPHELDDSSDRRTSSSTTDEAGSP